MSRFLSSLFALAIAASLGSGIAEAKTCRDAHGKFMKCPPAHMMMAKKPCRDAHGKFMKCKKM